MSKPILSELEYNADDVASAILQKADLSIANDDLGVLDISDKYDLGTNVSVEAGGDVRAYYFNGFVFIYFNIYRSSSISSSDVILSMNDTDYAPGVDVVFPSISYQGDSALHIEVSTSGDFKANIPIEEGTTNHYVCINGFYRT